MGRASLSNVQPMSDDSPRLERSWEFSEGDGDGDGDVLGAAAGARSSEGFRVGNRLVGLFGGMQTGVRFVANRTGMTAMTEEMRRAAKKAERFITRGRKGLRRSASSRLNPDDRWGFDDDEFVNPQDITGDFEQAPDEYYVLPHSSGWAILVGPGRYCLPRHPTHFGPSITG